MEARQVIITQLGEQITKLGGHFAAVPNIAAVSEYVNKLAAKVNVKHVAVCGTELADNLFPPGKLPSFEVASLSRLGRKNFFEVLRVAEIGISSVDMGVAETGTLILATSDELDRLVTALPTIHVAVLPRNKLVSSLDDAQSYVSNLLTRNFEPISISLISASSRTTDVGGITILGAHGPKELHVLLLEVAHSEGT